ncbi:short transient receptor potential channel 4-like [Styela clava]|uniref:short transient receptor potential channel 4-like n=1 Tax=Styela clava TaxID=7725 RepID=UPI001939D51E|nr:short transient receptor potential channel 4-like [Styela clava]
MSFQNQPNRPEKHKAKVPFYLNPLYLDDAERGWDESPNKFNQPKMRLRCRDIPSRSQSFNIFERKSVNERIRRTNRTSKLIDNKRFDFRNSPRTIQKYTISPKKYSTSSDSDENIFNFKIRDTTRSDGKMYNNRVYGGMNVSDTPGLTEVVTPRALKDAKFHLRKVSKPALSWTPATLWEYRQRKKRRYGLDKTQIETITAGYNVRRCLHDLSDDESIDAFYLCCVKHEMQKEVETIFTLAKMDKTVSFDKNCVDEREKSALIISIENRNLMMINILLKKQVNIGEAIFHAIESDFVDGVKAILDCDSGTNAKISGENHYFHIGMTPMLLAAYNNNYEILSLLYERDHRLSTICDWGDGYEEAWEACNERRMISKARACPAFITLMSELGRKNPITYCLGEIQSNKIYAQKYHEYAFYKGLTDNLEDYMCSLLDEICSSQELADFFHYDYEPMTSEKSDFRSFLKESKNRCQLGNRFKLLESASDENLSRFVTHRQPQLAMAYIRNRGTPFLRKKGWYSRSLISVLIGLMFPILSIFYIFAPNSKLGSLIKLPTVLFFCHLMSDIVFCVLLFFNIISHTVENDVLGALPTTVEWLIFVWILGKWVQEIQECEKRGPRSYFSDNWNYVDLIFLTFSTASIALRCVDILQNQNASRTLHRVKWSSYEPRLVADGLQSCAYLFAFVRLLGLLRVNQSLGPLQVSLGRMMYDVMRFLYIFLLMMCGFAFGLNHLYWYYGTKEGTRIYCSHKRVPPVNTTTSSSTTTADCTSLKGKSFSTILYALRSLFWALFGYFEPDNLALNGNHKFTEQLGFLMLGLYYGAAVIVMMNMLIAMLNNSYTVTSENEDMEWKFHRTSVWIRFFRREVIRPPPMNLIPNMHRIVCYVFRFGKNMIGRPKNQLENEELGTVSSNNMKNCGEEKKITEKKITQKEKTVKIATISNNEKGKINPSLKTDDEEGFYIASTLDFRIRNPRKKRSDTPVVTKDKRFSSVRRGAINAAIFSLKMNNRMQKSHKVLELLVRRYKLKYLLGGSPTNRRDSNSKPSQLRVYV